MTTHTNESITVLLQTSDKAVERAIIRIQENIKFAHLYNYDMPLVREFSAYLQGLDAWTRKKRYEPKSLNHPHCAPAFIKSGVISSDQKPMDLARGIALGNVDLLSQLANGQTPLYPVFYLRTVQNGRYKDTVNIMAYRNDRVPDDSNEWPRYSQNLGPVTADEISRSYLRLATLGISHDSFMENYTLVKQTDCYLD